ncbi:ALF repeat-containing protein [Streptomyces sp. NPDC002499]
MNRRTDQFDSAGKRTRPRVLRRAALGLLPLALAVGLLSAPPATAAAGPTDGIPAAVSAVDPADRGLVVDYWKAGGPGVKAAAEAALTGSDTDVQTFLAAADGVAFQDERVTAAQFASLGGSELLTAARTALTGTREELETFLSWGWEARCSRTTASGSPRSSTPPAPTCRTPDAPR